MVKEREEKLLKEVEIREKRLLLRWTTEYIEKNSERWEKEALVREQEQKRKLQDWEKKNRFEKIHFLKEKLRLKRIGNQESQMKEKHKPLKRHGTFGEKRNLKLKKKNPPSNNTRKRRTRMHNQAQH